MSSLLPDLISVHLVGSPTDRRSVSAKRGPIETPMTAGLDFSTAERRTKMLLGRSGKPEEVARVIGFLLGDDSSYITGSVQMVDGGWSC